MGMSLPERRGQECGYLVVHQALGCRINFQNIRIPWLHAAIKDNGWLQTDMKTVNHLCAAMNIGRWFKTCEKTPEKFLQRRGGLGCRINQQ